MLLRAFEALRGAGVRRPPHGRRRHRPRRSSRCCSTPRAWSIAGPVDDAEKWRLLGEADLLCAPSLGGESFGMVLTEAFASGTPVVASDIAGYRDVVAARHGRRACARGRRRRARRGAARAGLRPRPAHADGRRPRASARSASPGRTWPREVTEVYEQALARAGARPAYDARGPARRHRARRARSARAARAPAVARAEGPHRAGAGARPARRGACWWLRVPWRARASRSSRSSRLGIESIGRAIVAATPVWVLVAFALMCASMLRPRRGLARDPARRAARHARPPPRHRARNDDRRADVGDPAGAARRALARADRGAAAWAACATASRSCSARSSPRRS